MISTILKKNFCFYVTFILSSANAFNLDLSEDLLFGKEVKADKTLCKNKNGCKGRFELCRPDLSIVLGIGTEHGYC